jgi:ABC-type glycerol-3-phosphate transport system substrate-binding protein
MILAYDDRLILNEEAGELVHAFGDGYYIVDENGNEVNAFTEEEEFNRLIDKFKYRHQLIKQLNQGGDQRFSFGQDNVLLLNYKEIQNLFWDLPNDSEEVSLCFSYIMDVIIGSPDSKWFSRIH